jgi:hypothetical protein
MYPDDARSISAASRVRAGTSAEPGDVAEPTGEIIEVLAAPINPIDVAVSRGVLAIGHERLAAGGVKF